MDYYYYRNPRFIPGIAVAKHRKNWVRTIRYVLLAVWLSSYLLTLKFYPPQVITIWFWREEPKGIVVRSWIHRTGQKITVLFLVIGAVIFFVTALYESGGRQSTASHVYHKPRRQIGRGWFLSRPLVCARCASGRIHRSRRRDIEWMLMLVLIRPYRCHNCINRFYAFIPIVKLKRRIA